MSWQHGAMWIFTWRQELVVLTKENDTNNSQLPFCCYPGRVQAPSGFISLLVLLNDVRVPIEHPNSVYRADSAQMFIQTQNDGKNKLNRVYWQMRCGVINMACHTAVVRCELYSSKTFKNISRAGIMARTQDHLKCECQKIFRSQLLCCSYHRYKLSCYF